MRCISVSAYITLELLFILQLCHVWRDRVRKYKRWSFFVRYGKIQHLSNEQGVRLKAHTLLIGWVLYFPYCTQMNTVYISFNNQLINANTFISTYAVTAVSAAVLQWYHYTLQPFEQFRALYMHSPDCKYFWPSMVRKHVNTHGTRDIEKLLI